MPVSEPNLDHARQRGNKVAQTTLAGMITKHGLWDLPERRDCKLSLLPGACERWAAAKVAFVKAVEDLFEEDACNSF